MNLLNFAKANCKNCYRCLRECPVKAIKIKNEQAEIVEDRCIGCGQCFGACPQDARKIKSDLKEIKTAISEGKKVVASIAPSFAGAFEMKESGQVVRALKSLGFQWVEETAIGAEMVAEEYGRVTKLNSFQNIITTCCPSANYLVDTYFPALTKYLLPVVSPMLAHGKLIKKRLGSEVFLVFIGPCTGKKIEAISFQHKGTINAVLTFEELKNWLEDEDIEIETLEPMEFSVTSHLRGSSFPLEGGVINSIMNYSHLDKYEKLKVHGIDDCMEILRSLSSENISNVCVEINVCRGGCINGPGMPKDGCSFFKRQQRVKEYIKPKKLLTDANSPSKELKDLEIDLRKVFIERPIKKKTASASDIKEILKSMGKLEPEDELNCGGCGYNTCQEKAQAVYEGMAEKNMCLPYMRSKAESLTNLIFDSSPNIIILVDDKLQIKEFNPGAEALFKMKASEVKDLPVAILIDEDPFIDVFTKKQSILSHKVNYTQYDAVLLQNFLYLEKQNVVLAIMTNISKEEQQRKELKNVKEKTLDAAQKVIDEQMRVAQQIASLLGETTAETKVILTKLKEIAIEEGNIE